MNSVLHSTANELGYRLPAEFEPQSRVWLTTPHNPDTWPGCLDQAQQQFETFANTLAQYVEVKTTESLDIQTNDSWIRDYGPIFVVKENEIAIHDFTFNAGATNATTTSSTTSSPNTSRVISIYPSGFTTSSSKADRSIPMDRARC